jgi:hypothetical protein
MVEMINDSLNSFRMSLEGILETPIGSGAYFSTYGLDSRGTHYILSIGSINFTVFFTLKSVNPVKVSFDNIAPDAVLKNDPSFAQYYSTMVKSIPSTTKASLSKSLSRVLSEVPDINRRYYFGADSNTPQVPVNTASPSKKTLQDIAPMIDDLLVGWYKAVRLVYKKHGVDYLMGISAIFSYDFETGESFNATIPNLPDEGAEYLKTHKVGGVAVVNALTDDALEIVCAISQNANRDEDGGYDENGEEYEVIDLDDTYCEAQEYHTPDYFIVSDWQDYQSMPVSASKGSAWYDLTNVNLKLYQSLYTLIENNTDEFDDEDLWKNGIQFEFAPSDIIENVDEPSEYKYPDSVVMYVDSILKPSFLPKINKIWKEDLGHMYKLTGGRKWKLLTDLL